MNSSIIAMCGAPRAGKTELLLRLVDHLQTERLNWSEYPDRFAEMNIERRLQSGKLRAATGSILMKEKMLKMTLTGCSAVIFVISAHADEWDDQVAAYIECKRIAESMSVGPSQVPWLFILNKRDLGQLNPLAGLIDDGSNLVDTIAKRGEGVEQVGNWVIEQFTRNTSARGQ